MMSETKLPNDNIVCGDRCRGCRLCTPLDADPNTRCGLERAWLIYCRECKRDLAVYRSKEIAEVHGQALEREHKCTPPSK